MPLGDYLAGLAWFAVTLGAVGAATAIVTRRQLGHLDGEARLLAGFLVGVAALILVHLVPLALGLLSRPAPAVTGAILALALLRLPAAGAAPAPPPSPPPSSPMSWAVAGVGAGAAAVAALAYLGAVALVPFNHVDVVAFHLPNVARWIQSGSVWQVDQFLPYQTQGYYPHNGDIVQLAAVLPWHNDFAVRYVSLPFVFMTAAAVYALGRELGAPRAPAVLFGALAVTVPAVSVRAFDFGLPDTVMYSTFCAGVVFLLRHARTRRASDLVLAGVGLGIAFGTKWYAVPAVTVVVVVWAGALLLARRPWRRVVSETAALGALVLACGGFWLLRNLVESGNPFFPARIAPFGLTIFDAPFDRYRELAGFTLFDYAGQPAIWRKYVLPDFSSTFGFAWLLLCATTLGSLVLAARRRGSGNRDWRVVATVVAATLLALAYVLTPYSAFGAEGAPTDVAANTRYAVPALLLALGCAAWLAGRLGRAGIAVEILGLAAVGDAIRRGFDGVAVRHALTAVGVLALAGAAAWGWKIWRSRAPDARLARAALPAAACGLAVAIVVPAGYAAERRFNDRRYGTTAEAPLGWTRDERHRRIGLAGLWDTNGLFPVLPSFGPRLGNDVEFVGRFRRGMLEQHPRPEPFVRELRLGRYDLVVVGRATLPGTPDGEEGWARSAGYVEVARSPRLVLLRAPERPRGDG